MGPSSMVWQRGEGERVEKKGRSVVEMCERGMCKSTNQIPFGVKLSHFLGSGGFCPIGACSGKELGICDVWKRCAHVTRLPPQSRVKMVASRNFVFFTI